MTDDEPWETIDERRQVTLARRAQNFVTPYGPGESPRPIVRRNDGTKTFYPVQQWVEIPAADARRMGYLIADNRTFVLAVRSLAEARMRRMQGSVHVLANERRMLR